jgi:hypothetical protein
MRTLLLSVFLLGLPAVARGQDDFGGLRIKLGEIVYVTDTRTGVEVSGRLTNLSPSALTIDGHTFAPGEDLKIERRHNSMWTGAAIGFGLGAVMIYPIAPEPFGRGQIGRPINGILWGAVGALIGSAHKGRTTIYPHPQRAK